MTIESRSTDPDPAVFRRFRSVLLPILQHWVRKAKERLTPVIEAMSSGQLERSLF